ncbi:TPA: hypothetical protein ACY36A_000755 [Pasteurella multocida]
MAKNELLIIPQKEIDFILNQPKLLNIQSAKWVAKQHNQPSPQWLELKMVFLDETGIPIPNLRLHIQYRPNRRNEVLPSISILAIYKGRRILGVDQCQGVCHKNNHIDVVPTPPSIVEGPHYHILHEKHNQETGYPLEIPIDKQSDIAYFLKIFTRLFNTKLIGELPYPLQTNVSQMELSL